MKTLKISSVVIFLLMILVLSQSQAQNQQQAEEIIKNWPETAQKAAKATIDKYGEPDAISEEILVWFDSGDWDKTVIQREEIDHKFPMPHKDVLYQEIKLDIPPDKYDELAEYDGSVIVERTKGTIGARCDKEAANYLAVNLAHDIVEGKKSVEEARQFYAETMKNMMEKNESSEYLEGFLFEVPKEGTGDPDEALIDKSEL